MATPHKPIPEIIQTLLALKYRASAGNDWTSDEIAQLNGWLHQEGITRVLAACCVISSQWQREYDEAFKILLEAIKGTQLPYFVEEFIYDSLTSVGSVELDEITDDLLSFIQRSIKSQKVNLVNPIYVLGRLVRLGHSEATLMLQALADNSDPEVRYCVSLVLPIK